MNYTEENILNDIKFREMTLNTLSNVLDKEVCYNDFESLLRIVGINRRDDCEWSRELAKSLRRKWQKKPLKNH